MARSRSRVSSVAVANGPRSHANEDDDVNDDDDDDDDDDDGIDMELTEPAETKLEGPAMPRDDDGSSSSLAA